MEKSRKDTQNIVYFMGGLCYNLNKNVQGEP